MAANPVEAAEAQLATVQTTTAEDKTEWVQKFSVVNSPTKVQGSDCLVGNYGDLEERLGRVRHYYNQGGLNYDDLWGKGNIHFGIFPALDEGTTSQELLEKGVSFLDGAVALNDLMIKLSGIDSKARVLDWGSGYGGPARYLGSKTGAKVLGIDLAEANVEKANAVAKEEGVADKVRFIQGSFLELPEAAKEMKCTHIWNQLGICHCYQLYEDICKAANQALPIGGRIVWNDYVGNKPETELVRQFVCDLMHYSHLITSEEYLETLRKYGFEIEHHKCEEWKEHFLLGHDLLIKRALELGMEKSADWYRSRKEAVRQGLYSHQVTVARKIRDIE